LRDVCGIVTKDECGLPVGETPVSDEISNNEWICPHIYGGIPTMKNLGVVKTIYPILRRDNTIDDDDDGGREFLRIDGLTS